MNFQDYLKNARTTLITDPKKVAEEFKANLSLMETEDDVMAMTDLIVHVYGHHLGQWQNGIELLRKIKNNARINDKLGMKRFVAILDLGNNPNISIDQFSSADQVSIYTTVAIALSSLGGLKNGYKLLAKAHEIVSTLPKEDSAHEIIKESIKVIISNLKAESEQEKEFLSKITALGSC